MFRRRRQGLPPADGSDEWIVATDVDGVIYRFSTTVRPFAGHTDHTIRIGVALPARNPRGDGFPSEDETAAWDATEDVVIRQAGRQARLVAVITAFGFREYLLYTASDDWLAGFHERLQNEISSHEVQMVAAHDPGWSAYLAIAGSAG